MLKKERKKVLLYVGMLSLIKLFKPIAIPRTCTQWACFLKYFLQVLQNKLMMESESLL